MPRGPRPGRTWNRTMQTPSCLKQQVSERKDLTGAWVATGWPVTAPGLARGRLPSSCHRAESLGDQPQRGKRPEGTSGKPPGLLLRPHSTLCFILTAASSAHTVPQPPGGSRAVWGPGKGSWGAQAALDGRPSGCGAHRLRRHVGHLGLLVCTAGEGASRQRR